MPVFGFRFGNFTYITDANSISETEMQKIKGSKVIVVNALRREPHISHFNLEEALAFLDTAAPGKAYLTHISHQLGRHNDVEAELPVGVHCAYDGLVLEL